MPTRKQHRIMAAPAAKAPQNGYIGIYIRRSEDDERSKSCADQERLGLRAAKALGFPEDKVRIYREREGVKGTWTFRQTEKPGPHREQLTRLVEDVLDGETTAIWSWNVDRIVRDPQICLDLGGILGDCKTRLVINTREVDTSTSEGLYNLVQESIQARRQRDRAAEDVKRDKLFKAEMGMLTRDPSSYGWRSAGRGSQEAVPRWEELAVIEMAMQWFVHGDGLSGPLGLNQIAMRLMDLGIVLSVGARGHTSKDARKVTPAQVERILSNPMHVARWFHGGTVYDFSERLLVSRCGEAPRTAVPLELYEAVQERLLAMPERTPRSGKRERLCKNVAVCGCCGKALQVNVKNYVSGAKLERYFCPHRVGRLRTCHGDTYATLAVEELEGWVRGQLAPMVAEELRAMGAEAAGNSVRRELAQARRALEEAAKKETDGLLAMLQADLDEIQRKSVSQALRADRQRLERGVAEIEERLQRAAALGAGEDDLSAASVPRLREALGRCVRWIALTDRGIVVLTSAGRYLRSLFCERDMSLYGVSENRRRPEARIEEGGREWLGDPEAFVRGRREVLGRLVDGLSDEELLP